MYIYIIYTLIFIINRIIQLYYTNRVKQSLKQTIHLHSEKHYKQTCLAKDSPEV